MKKTLAGVLVFALLISGCGLFKKDPQKAVNDGIAKFGDVKKMSSSLVLNGTMQAPPGEEPQKVQFAVNASGKTDVTDDTDPKFDTNLKIQASFDDQSGSGELEFKTVDKKIFVNLKNLELPGEQGAALKTQISSLFNAWWTLPLGKESPFGQLAEEQKKLQEHFKTTKFFTNATEEGTEVIQGMNATRYRVELDKEALKKFVVDVARISDNQLSPEEELAIQSSLEDVEFSGAVWIGDDDIAHRIRGTVTLQPTQGPSSSFDIDYTGWDYGKDVVVSAPEGAKDFNPIMLLPFLGAFGSLDAGGDDEGITSEYPAVPGTPETEVLPDGEE